MTNEQPPAAPLSVERLEALKNLKIGEGEFGDASFYVLPEEKLKNWMSLDVDRPVVLPLTRRDIDHLFFSMTQITAAIGTLQHCVLQMTVGDAPGANVYFGKSQELRRLAENNFRQFYGAIMGKAFINE